MISQSLRLSAFALALTLTACSHVPTSNDPPAPARPAADPLFQHAWQLTQAPTLPARGSLYVFLANGTLLETSCGEPYRIALWTRDPADPHVLHVVEDQLPVFTATIADVNDKTLHLQQKLTRVAVTNDLTFTAIDQEFVCPDLPK